MKNSRIKTPANQRRVPAMPLPFAPTNSPGHEHVLAASNAMLLLVQTLFAGNPKPTITALKAAEHAYSTALAKEGMPAEEIEEQEVLGIRLAAVLLANSEEAKKQAETNIITQPSGLVGADGQPIMSTGTTTLEPEPETEPDSENETKAVNDEPLIVLATK